jgi:hypothetical protein
MRLSSRHLHQLVRSFSASEKMLFKRFNRQSGAEAAYLILFDVLAGMKEYDEAMLQKKLRQKRAKGYLKSLKTYLYDQVMLFLRNSDKGSNKRWKMRELNMDADLLFARGLKRNALELYDEQLALARNASNPSYEIAAIDNFIAYAARSINVPMLQEYEKVLAERLKAFHNLVEVQIEFRKISNFYNDNYPIRDAKALAALNKIARSALMRREDNMLSAQALIFYCNFHLFICLLKSDYEDAFKLARKRYELQQNLDPNLEGLLIRKVSTLEIMIKTAQKSGRVKEALDFYNELDEFACKSGDLRLQIVKYACFSFIHSFTDWKKGNPANRKAARDFFMANKAASSAVATGMLNLAYTYFRLKDYDHVLTLVNGIMDEKYSYQQAILQTEARLLAIITHYELRNYLLISYLVTNTRRYLKQQEKLYPLENALLNGIKHLPEKINETDMRKALLKLRTSLLKITENPLERNAMSGFDFIDWIDRKLGVAQKE